MAEAQSITVDDLVRAADREFGDCFGPGGVEASGVAGDDDDQARAQARWLVACRALPGPVAALLRTIEVASLRMQALVNIEDELFGWSERADGGRRLDQETVRRTWRLAWSGARHGESVRVVRSALDNAKALAQAQRIQEHEPAPRLPAHQRVPTVIQGVLHVRENQRGRPNFGIRSYTEATPVEVVVHTVRRWMAFTGGSRPRCWDLTAGAGTVHDVVTRVFDGMVVGTDIAIDNAITTWGNLDQVGRHAGHVQHREVPGVSTPPLAKVLAPDLVFVHPPSRGWPACTWIYGARTGLEVRANLHAELTYEFDRRFYTLRVARAVRTALGRLTPGGLVSLLIPEYTRFHAAVTPEPGIANEIVALIGADADIVEQHEVVDDAPVRQASLDRNRGPLRHLIVKPAGKSR